MSLINRIKHIFTDTDWKRLCNKIQIISAYLPLLLVPIIFSPLSVEPLYVEKIFVILFFSLISLLSLFIKNLLYYSDLKKKISLKSKDKKISEDVNNITFFYNKFLKYYLIFLSISLISTLFSISFNMSLWGTGFVLFMSIYIWLIAIYQVYELQKIKTSIIIGISLVALFSLILLITRFNGSGIWSMVSLFKFSPTGDFYSLVLILFIGIYLSLKSIFTGKFKYLNISALFLNLTAYIIYSFITGIYIFAYIALALLLTVYFIENTNLKYLILSKINKKPVKMNKKVLNLNKNDINLKLIIVSASVFISIFELIFQKSVLIFYRDSISMNFSWSIMIKSLIDNIKNFFIGIGPNQYDFTFLHFKPQDINNSPYWLNEYVNSNHGVFEFISSFGLLTIILLLIYLIKTKKISLKLNFKEFPKLFFKYKPYDLLFVLFLIVFLFITPFILTTFFVLISLIVIFKGNPERQEISLNVKKENSFFNYNYKLLYAGIFLLFPLIIVSILFYTSSFLVGIGTYKHNMPSIDKGVSLFSYYPNTYSKIVNSIDNLSEDNLDTNYLSQAQSYARSGLQLNPNDTNAISDVIKSLISKQPVYNDLSLSLEFYTKLLSISPQHIPYLLNISDIQMRVGNYQQASDILDQALEYNPQIDIVLLRRANAAFLLNKYDEAKGFAEKALNYTQKGSIKDSTRILLDRIDLYIDNIKTQ